MYKYVYVAKYGCYIWILKIREGYKIKKKFAHKGVNFLQCQDWWNYVVIWELSESIWKIDQHFWLLLNSVKDFELPC